MILSNYHKNTGIQEDRHMYSIHEKTYLEQTVFASVNEFCNTFKIGNALKRAGAYKRRGIPVMHIIVYLIMLVYGGKTMNRDIGNKSNAQGSKDAVYRFLRCKRINWNLFLMSVAANVISVLRRLTSDGRRCAIAIDDTLHHRPYGKGTELASKVYDHNDHRYKCGFRSLFLAWTDGATLIPLCFGHMASSDKSKQYRKANDAEDKRTCAHRAKTEAQMKSTDVMFRMLSLAKRFAIPADYVLFDSWFSFPAVIAKIREIGYHTIGRLKNTTKIHYLFQGKKQTLKQIYASEKKRRGRSRYLLSVPVSLADTDGKTIDARIVYVRNRNKRKDWIAFICTDIGLSEDEIIALYGRRWSIEVFFKTCKTYLRFTGEFRQTSYEAITAHTAVVALRYMMLAVGQRRQTDQRTLGELFYAITDEAKDVTFQETLILIMELLSKALSSEYVGLDRKRLNKIMESFMDALPSAVGRLLQPILSCA
jgi:hypothetical protein